MSSRRATLLERDGYRVRVVHVNRVAKANNDAIRESELDRLAQVFKP